MSTPKPARVYIFDASVFINLHLIDTRTFELPQEIWDKLDELMLEGRIISHRYVYDEVVTTSDNPDKVSKWLQPRKSHFYLPTARQVEVMANVVNAFPKLIDPNNEKDQADPYLVAMGVELNETHNDVEHVVVTLEKQSKTIGLAAACRSQKVECITPAQFFDEIGIKIGVRAGSVIENAEPTPTAEAIPETI